MMSDEWWMMNGEFGEVFSRIPLFFSTIISIFSHSPFLQFSQTTKLLRVRPHFDVIIFSRKRSLVLVSKRKTLDVWFLNNKFSFIHEGFGTMINGHFQTSTSFRGRTQLLLSFLPLQICVNPRLSAAKKSFFFLFFRFPSFLRLSYFKPLNSYVFFQNPIRLKSVKICRDFSNRDHGKFCWWRSTHDWCGDPISNRLYFQPCSNLLFITIQKQLREFSRDSRDGRYFFKNGKSLAVWKGENEERYWPIIRTQ